ncbi:MAG: electron transfer flavoprotein subunit beta/FixA family protein [Deltaproteobacteria bacterium]|nr:electron transfer flavoprotein subunit beta/FixA family protein [Deltaproteobacteria bacterium]
MKILVCIKQVPDSEGVLSISNSGKGTEFEGTYRMNHFDEFALEEALRIRENMPVESIDAVSVGPARIESTIRKALEMGASRGIHIITEGEDHISPLETATRIASFAGEGGYDLILAGVMAEDDMQSQVGPMIAEMLGYPSASSVICEEIDPEKGILYAEREIESGVRECLEMKLPALLTIQSGINRPRYPALSNVLRARAQEITVLVAHPGAKPEKREEIVTFRYPETTSKGLFLEGDKKEKARELIHILHEKSII